MSPDLHKPSSCKFNTAADEERDHKVAVINNSKSPES